MSDKLKFIPNNKEELYGLPYVNDKAKLTEMHFVQLAMKNLILVSDKNLELYFIPAFNALLLDRKRKREERIINSILPISNYDPVARNHYNNDDGA